jgi:hypothetical protein
MECWMPIVIPAKAAANEVLPGLRARSGLGILEVGRYRKVVLAAPATPTERHGTFFSSSA